MDLLHIIRRNLKHTYFANFRVYLFVAVSTILIRIVFSSEFSAVQPSIPDLFMGPALLLQRENTFDNFVELSALNNAFGNKVAAVVNSWL